MRRAAAIIAGSCGLWLALPGMAAAQRLAQGSHYDPPWWRVIGALLLCVALAVAAALVLRGRLNGPLASLLASKGAAPKRLQVLETVRLTHQVDVCLLRLDGRELLVAVSNQGATSLNTAHNAPPPPEDQP